MRPAAASTLDPPLWLAFFSNHDLKYAAWTGAAWSIQTVAVGQYTSLAPDPCGKPKICCYDGTAMALNCAD
jgi:hypothetical protein